MVLLNVRGGCTSMIEWFHLWRFSSSCWIWNLLDLSCSCIGQRCPTWNLPEVERPTNSFTVWPGEWTTYWCSEWSYNWANTATSHGSSCEKLYSKSLLLISTGSNYLNIDRENSWHELLPLQDERWSRLCGIIQICRIVSSTSSSDTCRTRKRTASDVLLEVSGYDTLVGRNDVAGGISNSRRINK